MLAYVLPQAGRTSEGETEFRTSLDIAGRLVAENPAVRPFRRNLGLTRDNSDDLLLDMGRPAEAEVECRKALALIQPLVDKDPTDAENRFVLAFCHKSLGLLMLYAGNPADAEFECRKAVALMEKLVTDDSSVGLYKDVLVAIPNDLGDVFRSTSRTAEARSPCDRAIAFWEGLSRKEPTNLWFRRWLACSIWRRGQTLRDLGDPAADARRSMKLFNNARSRSGNYTFETACANPTLASLDGRAGSGVSAAEGEGAAAKAMEWLGRAVAYGYRNTNRFRIKSALDPLRDRPDFKKLM